MARNRHHLLFPQAEWELRPQSLKLRRTSSLIPSIRGEVHDYIHEEVPIVPLLGHHVLNSVPALFTPRGETMRDIDGLCSAIDRAAAPQRVHRIERDLAGLAIEALIMQKDILRDAGY